MPLSLIAYAVLVSLGAVFVVFRVAVLKWDKTGGVSRTRVAVLLIVPLVFLLAAFILFLQGDAIASSWWWHLGFPIFFCTNIGLVFSVVVYAARKEWHSLSDCDNGVVHPVVVAIIVEAAFALISPILGAPYFFIMSAF